MVTGAFSRENAETNHWSPLLAPELDPLTRTKGAPILKFSEPVRSANGAT